MSEGPGTAKFEFYLSLRMCEVQCSLWAKDHSDEGKAQYAGWKQKFEELRVEGRKKGWPWHNFRTG